MDKEEIAKRIIYENNFCVIATTDLEGNPWVTPVYFAYDDTYNFYWYSQKTTKHSQLIKQNNKVAIVIFNSQFEETHPAEQGYGVYIAGKAKELKKKEIHQALTIYFSRLFAHNSLQKEKMIQKYQDFLGESPLRMYTCAPEKIYISNTATIWKGKYLDSRSEVRLLYR